tara:strand:+ start:2741 stop:4558 length:1818 start_codon:yes stop_codon:yes gene_type:complete
MGELKHGFGAAKMNKDADERIVPNGEYRDALNIEIVTSEGSNTGAMQTLLGNSNISNDDIAVIISPNTKCVGSIADEKNNNLYYFISDPNNFTDYIFQYNSDNEELIPIVVDKWRMYVTTSSPSFSPTTPITSFKISDLNNPIENITNVRPGMVVSAAFVPTGGSGITIDINPHHKVIVNKMKHIVSNEWEVQMDDLSGTTTLFSGTGLETPTPTGITLTADRALNFDDNKHITGINIIDGIIYWTDGETEPKKVDIKNIETDISGLYHSKFLVKDYYGNLITNLSSNIDFRENPDYLKEQHLTVIKKSPLYPPTILLSNTSDFRFNSGTTSILYSKIDDIFVDSNDDTIEVGGVKNTQFHSPIDPDYKVGDLILLRKDNSFELVPDLDNFEIIAEILEYTPGIADVKLKIVFIKKDIGQTFGSTDTFNTVLQQEKPLYEFKFPRFAYRYKYQNNQYSPYSPFSEPAFLPGEFNYNSKEGYNLGMVNTLRSVYVMDFLPDQDTLPKDVIEIDVVYKESNTNNIYIVQTIKYGDDEWIAEGSAINTYNSGDSRTKGALLITSEMVKSAVASNQLLRPYDNVPRTARAQDIVGNRIVYANYKQNYNL